LDNSFAFPVTIASARTVMIAFKRANHFANDLFEQRRVGMGSKLAPGLTHNLPDFVFVDLHFQ